MVQYFLEKRKEKAIIEEKLKGLAQKKKNDKEYWNEKHFPSNFPSNSKVVKQVIIKLASLQMSL